MVNREELKKKIPHGYCKIIASRAGVTQKSLSAYFKYQHNSERIENTILEVLVELKEKKEKLLCKI